MSVRAAARVLAGLVLATGACGRAPAPSVLPAGTWGGQHIGLDVSETATRIEFDCAHGTVDGPWPLDRDGRFSVDGQYVREQGGPVHEGQPEDVQPAVYSGALDGSTVSVSTQLADGTRIGPFTAVLGRTPNVFKCL